jgi:hypothetical protein
MSDPALKSASNELENTKGPIGGELAWLTPRRLRDLGLILIALLRAAPTPDAECCDLIEAIAAFAHA